MGVTPAMLAALVLLAPTPTDPARPAPPPPRTAPSTAGLAAIAACESGGDPSAVSADGRYRGLLQFDMQTWVNVGGTGDPAAASPAEQLRRGAALRAQRGSAPWPNCG